MGVAVGVGVGVGVPKRLWCSRECPVAAVPGACAVGRYDAEMVTGARSQATDVSSHILVRVPGLTLVRRGVPIAGRRAILEMDSRG